jgi:mTERF domain-containing protein
MAACAEGIGLPRGSGMFRQALQAVAFLSKDKITAKVDYLKKTFRWCDAEVSIALTKAPSLLRRSKDMLRRRSEFLILEVGLEPVYIAHRPVIISLSLECRLKPRHYVLKFLKENGIVDHDWSFSTAVMKTDDVFVAKYICPHKEVAPHLAEDYAAACRGELPTNFRFA